MLYNRIKAHFVCEAAQQAVDGKGCVFMKEIGKEYLVLFNGISNTITELETTIFKLRLLQARAEDTYLASNEDTTEVEPAR